MGDARGGISERRITDPLTTPKPRDHLPTTDTHDNKKRKRGYTEISERVQEKDRNHSIFQRPILFSSTTYKLSQRFNSLPSSLKLPGPIPLLLPGNGANQSTLAPIRSNIVSSRNKVNQPTSPFVSETESIVLDARRFPIWALISFHLFST